MSNFHLVLLQLLVFGFILRADCIRDLIRCKELKHAASQGAYDKVRSLVPDKIAANCDSNAALKAAVENSNVVIADYLIWYGADPAQFGNQLVELAVNLKPEYFDLITRIISSPKIESSILPGALQHSLQVNHSREVIWAILTKYNNFNWGIYGPTMQMLFSYATRLKDQQILQFLVDRELVRLGDEDLISYIANDHPILKVIKRLDAPVTKRIVIGGNPDHFDRLVEIAKRIQSVRSDLIRIVLSGDNLVMIQRLFQKLPDITKEEALMWAQTHNSQTFVSQHFGTQKDPAKSKDPNENLRINVGQQRWEVVQQLINQVPPTNFDPNLVVQLKAMLPQGIVYYYPEIVQFFEYMKSVADAYHILGVTLNASCDEIKKVHRNLIFKYHPDRNIDNSQAAAEKSKNINSAKDIINEYKKCQ